MVGLLSTLLSTITIIRKVYKFGIPLNNMFSRISEDYRIYRNVEDSYCKKGRFMSFLSAFFNYIFRRPKPIIFTDEQRRNYERGLDERIRQNYEVHYGPNIIRWVKKKDLASNL